MPTHSKRNHAVAESSQIIDAVVAEQGNDGTAVALKNAVEESDAEIYGIDSETSLGKKKATVWCKHGHAGEEGPVPKPLHDQLTDWGYQHAGEKTGDYEHTEAWGEHVYVKD